MRSKTAWQPPRPEPARFDPVLNAWVLSRYTDVQAALREPRLCQVGPRRKRRSEICMKGAQSRRHTELRANLPHRKLAEWQAEIEFVTDRMIDQLPGDRFIDLVREFIRPWSVAVALTINETDPVHCRRLIHVSKYLPFSETDCYNSVLRSRAAAALAEFRLSVQKSGGVKPICKSAFAALYQALHASIASASFALPKRAAKAEFERLNRQGAISLGKSVFLGTSQTIPFFLASAWLALLRHPSELERLRAEPALIPKAIEELLRYAGIVHTLFREATAAVELGDVRILEGQRVILKLGSANWDPAQFPEPDRLDVTRRVMGQVALGAGANSCVGASLVRMATAIATSAFIRKCAVAETSDNVEWYRNDTIYSPASLRLVLRSASPPDTAAQTREAAPKIVKA
jgi:cytochrome P450